MNAMLPRPLLALAGSALLFIAHDAVATAQRTFVASTGDDTHTCAIAQPCRSFATAIMQTSVDGEVVVLDSAGYGPVTVTKSVSIIAPPGIYAGISVFSGDGIKVNAPGGIVVLRGLSINGQGGNRGIFLQAAARLRIENCVVSRMGAAGILHSAAGAEMSVRDTVVRDNAGAGIDVTGDLPSAVLDHVRSEHNGGDGFHLAPTAGSLGALATITDSVFTHNGGNGIAADSVSGATFTIVVERGVMASNGLNGFVANVPGGSAGVATVSRSALNDNAGDGLSILGAGTINSGALGNAAHRNSGAGFRFEVMAPGFLIGVLKDNIGNRNLSTDLHCLGPGATVTDQTNVFPSFSTACNQSHTAF